MKDLENRRSAPTKMIAWIVFFATLLAFLPALRNGFVDWDDGAYLLSNPHFRGFNWPNLRWMLTTVNIGHYIPITWLSFSLDYSLWGLNPAGYHATNVLLHALNASLFFLISRRLLAAAFSEKGWDAPSINAAAAFSALFFALHPLRVESVAWAFERKDVLSGFFYLGTVYAYLRACAGVTGRQKNWRIASLALFGMSLLSKAIGVSLPLTLVVLDAYPLRRLPRKLRQWASGASSRILAEKIPYALMSAAAGTVTYLSHENLGATMRLADYGVGMRGAQSFFGLIFYLEKTVLPLGLSPRYTHPSLNPFAWPYLASALSVLALTGAFWFLRKRFPGGLAAWINYKITLAPVIGIIPQSSQIAADRYTYLPCLAWALCAGAGVGYWTRRNSRAGALGFAAAASVLLALAALTWSQIAVWHDSASLWRHAVELNPRDVIALDGLGKALAARGQQDEAMEEFQAALALNPSYAASHNNLGALLAGQGKIKEAIGHFQAALASNPNDSAARHNLEKALRLQGSYGKPAR